MPPLSLDDTVKAAELKHFFTHDRLWTARQKRLHIYLRPDLAANPDLAALITKARKVMTTFFPDEVTLIDDEWLHLTVASLPFEVADMNHLCRSLRHALQGIPRFTLRMGSVMATSSSLLLDADDPENRFAQLCNTVSATITDSTDRTPIIAADPHLSLGYGAACATVDSGQISNQMRGQCRPPHAALAINEVLLVLVTQDHQNGVYTWDCIDYYPLSPIPAPKVGIAGAMVD